jgi:hypothetical protein
MQTGPREWTCSHCGLCHEAAQAITRCEHCGSVMSIGPEAPSTRSFEEDRKHAILVRLRQRYSEARSLVPWEPPLDADSFSHLEWILGEQRNTEHDETALDTEVSELVVLWLQDLARELDNDASLPGDPGSGDGAVSTADVRYAAAGGLRTATRDFAEAFLSSELVPVPNS